MSPMRLLHLLLLTVGTAATAQAANAATYTVDGAASAAADTNAGTAAHPWKTLSRAASAAELKPGDTVRLRSGIYRKAVNITIAGTPGHPLMFAAAPGAAVVIKGSTIIAGA